MTRAGIVGDATLNGNRYRVAERAVSEIDPLAQQIRTGLTDSDRSDEYETASRFVTCHLGFGIGEIRDAADKGRYHYSQNVDARTRGQLILGPKLSESTFSGSSESKVQFVEFNSTFFAIGARYVHKYNEGTGQWDLDKDMGASAAAIKGCAAVYGSYLVVAAGSSVSYWRRDTSGTWDQPYSTNKPSLFAIVGNTLWMVYSKNQLSSSSDFTTWASAVSVGDSNRSATLLTDYNGNPLVGKPEGLFEYDGTKVSNRLPELAYRINSDNCRGGKPSRGKLFIPVGPALWQYTADAVQTEGKPTRSTEALAAGITRGSSNEVRGSIKDIWPDVDFLWCILAAQSGNYYIAAYDFNPAAGQGWHQVAKTGGTAVTALGRFQPSSGNPLLFYSESTTIKYFVLPADAQNPYVDTAYRYATTGSIFLPVEGDTFDDVNKAYLAVKLSADNLLTGSRYVDLYYSIDGSAETSLGRVETSGLSEVLFPSSTTGTRIYLRLDLTTDDATQTPRVLVFSRHFQYRFETKRRWALKLLLTRDALPNVPKQGNTQLTDLETARDTVAPVTFVDIDRRTWTVFVKKVGQAEIVDDGGDKVWSVEVELTEWRTTGTTVTNITAAAVDALAFWGILPDVSGIDVGITP